jgi:hypothetical protein
VERIRLPDLITKNTLFYEEVFKGMQREIPNTFLSIALFVSFSFVMIGCGGTLDFPVSSQESNLNGPALNFSRTVYPILKNHCSQCHGAGQPPLIAFTNDIQRSYDGIIVDPNLVRLDNPDSSKIVQKIRAGHNCWSNCASNSDDLLTAVENWAALEGTAPTTNPSLRTANMLVPMSIGTIGTTANLTFSLATLAPGLPADAKIVLTMRRLDNFSYLITNVRAQSTVSFHIYRMNVYVNNRSAAATGAFSLIDTIVPITSGNNFFSISGASSLIPVENGPGQDNISLEFETLEVVTPAQQRFLAVQNIIRTTCTSCHTGSVTFMNQGLNANVTVPAFSQFGTEAEWLNRAIGTNRYLVVRGDPQNSVLFKAVAHMTGAYNFLDINRSMAPGTSAAVRTPQAEAIRLWIQNLP